MVLDLNLENGVDFISKMPDPILELILQGLPTTKEVVRTSVLSKRWRFLWTSIPRFPSLNIDFYHPQRPDNITDEQAEPLINFVSWALANETVDLDSFRLCCAGYFEFRTVKKLIKAAVNRNVKSLDLKFRPKCRIVIIGLIDLPDYLVSCKSLESLRLFVYGNVVSLGGCERFVRLKVLKLHAVYCSKRDSVEKFLEKCPLLEDLSLLDCLSMEETSSISSSKLKTLIIRNCQFRCGLTVCCPKLVNFEYVGLGTDVIHGDLDSLKKAVIHPVVDVRQKISPELGKTASTFLAGISHVESLSLNLFFILCIDAARDQKGNFPASFPNLKTLEVTTTIDAFTMNVIVRILKCSPNLESLHLVIHEEHLTTEYWTFDEAETSRILTYHLKKVKFLGINGEKRKLVIARHLLEHGNALEEMIFSWCSEVKYREKSMEMMNEMSKFYKASSTVKLISVLKD